MGVKVNIFTLSIEFLLVAYVLLDVYTAIFNFGFNDIVSLEDTVVGSNATNEDPKVVEIGKFAVDEYNKLTRSNLKFEALVRALFAKSSYMLLIQVMDGTFSESKEYVAIVKNLGTQMILIEFEEYMESGI
ncbi:hypothetical protein CDL12_07534 [Handroanthus impetiginosus]|uniref:Cystatin domain-containing protein n=1 Tax=Handroanthus impetiginosus TaxID=429701 RepID=A0A2G9HQH2_9LAMI|nr:hypothetical protein CDL12_07534 [Handroanthus impetiginosus]